MLHFRRTMPRSTTELRTGPQKVCGDIFRSIAVGLALINGCAHAPEVDTVVHEAPRGSVTLERIPDRGVKAAHPIAIEEGIIARALSGVRVTERKTALQTAFSKQSSMTRHSPRKISVFWLPS